MEENKDTPTAQAKTDVVKIVASIMSKGAEAEKIAEALQEAAKAGAMSEEDLNACMQAIKQAGQNEEKNQAENAYGMKFLAQ